MTELRHPRYYVRSISGYSLVHGGSRLGTTWWVSDSWNLWREVPLTNRTKGSTGTQRITRLRKQAERNCAALNAAHEEWLAND